MLRRQVNLHSIKHAEEQAYRSRTNRLATYKESNTCGLPGVGYPQYALAQVAEPGIAATILTRDIRLV